MQIRADIVIKSGGVITNGLEKHNLTRYLVFQVDKYLEGKYFGINASLSDPELPSLGKLVRVDSAVWNSENASEFKLENDYLLFKHDTTDCWCRWDSDNDHIKDALDNFFIDKILLSNIQHEQ